MDQAVYIQRFVFGQDTVVPDPQPANALSESGKPQRLYPQCLSCSRKQGLAIARKQAVLSRVPKKESP